MAVAARLGVNALVFVAWIFVSLVCYGFGWLCLHGIWLWSNVADVIAWNLLWLAIVWIAYESKDDEDVILRLWRPWIFVTVQVGLLTVYAVKCGVFLVFLHPGTSW